MRNTFRVGLAVVSACMFSQTSTGQIISQVYGGGGTGSSRFNRDFVEIYNNTPSTINLSGLSLVYGSAGGNIASTTANQFNFTAGTIPAGRYFLVAFRVGGAGSALPATPDIDATGSLSLAGSAGKVALVTTASFTPDTKPNRGSETASPYLDFVGYGTTADRFEGPSATDQAPATIEMVSIIRQTGGGSVNADLVPLDTNINSSDFIRQTLNSGTPIIRNSAFVPVPEPATVLAVAAGGLGLLRLRRRLS